MQPAGLAVMVELGTLVMLASAVPAVPLFRIPVQLPEEMAVLVRQG
jgi:hypothetical protein